MPQVTSLFLHSTRALTPLWTCSDEGCQHLPAQRPTPAHLNTTSSIALTQSQPSAPHQALPHAASHSSTLALQLHQLGPPPPRTATPFLPSRPHPALSLPPAPPYPTPPFSPPSPAMPHAQGQASVPPRPGLSHGPALPAPLPSLRPRQAGRLPPPPRPGPIHRPGARPYPAAAPSNFSVRVSSMMRLFTSSRIMSVPGMGNGSQRAEAGGSRARCAHRGPARACAAASALAPARHFRPGCRGAGRWRR